MKIIYLASTESIHSIKWISFFENIGHEICVVSLFPDRPEGLKTVQFEHLEQPTHLFGWISAVVKLRRIIKNFRPDIMHTHSAGTYGLLALLSGFRHKVLTVWGSDIILNSQKFFLSAITKRILKNNILITTDASHMIAKLMGLGVEQENIKLINFGVDVEKFKPKFDNSVHIKNKYNLGVGPCIISTRNFEEIYDVGTLIEAAKLVLIEFPDARFYLGGRGSKKHQLEKLIRDLNVNEQVQFLGFIENDELPDLLSLMDVYVSTSLSDAGIAASTAEAMSCGVVPVITDVYDNSDWVLHGRNGLLFHPGSSQDLAHKLISILKMKTKSHNGMKILAREKIVNNNNYFVEMKKMEDLLASIVS